MASTTMPSEVQAYFASGRKKIIAVTPNDDLTLTITFNNDESRIYDMRETLNKPEFSSIRTLERFKSAYIDDAGAIAWDIDPNVDSDKVWDNKLDICPDSCYIYGKPL